MSLLAYALGIHILWVEASPTSPASYLLLGCIDYITCTETGVQTLLQREAPIWQNLTFYTIFCLDLRREPVLTFSRK